MVRTWLGVPYATPPLDALRFKPPRPALRENGGSLGITLSMDYCFMTAEEAEEDTPPVLVMYERVREVLFGHQVNQKGVGPIILKQLVQDLDAMGIKRAIDKSDQEPALRALLL